MNFIWDKITEWLKGLLVSGIISNLSGLFDAINTRVGEAAAVVGTTPQAWHGGIFQMIRSLSENVVVPIAGIILTVGFALFPFILPSSVNPNIGLTAWDASSSHLTLWVMLIATIIFLPIVLSYTSYVYYIMRGKVSEKSLDETPNSY